MSGEQQATPETKDLAYYMDNPDELALLPAEQVEKILSTAADEPVEEADDQVTDPVVKEGDTAQTPDAAAAAAAEAKPEGSETPAAAATDTAQTVEPEGVLAKDGKHVLPFSALQTAREQALEAQRLATQQAERIKQLEAEVAGGKKADTEAVTFLTDDELAELEESVPTLAKAIRAQQTMLQQIAPKLERVEQTEQQRMDTERQLVARTVQQDIDAVPELAFLQAMSGTQPGPWQAAVEIDKQLKAAPMWRDKPQVERFQKVAEVFQQMYGQLPVAPKQTTQQPQKPDPAALAAAAKAQIDKATATPSVPASMSSIPGGATPAVDVAESMLNKSGAELAADFLNKTPEQIEAMLSRM